MENEVRGLFDQLVADPPATSVNVDAAIRGGRRRLAQRRQAWIGTTAAAALAGAATFSALTGGTTPAPGRPDPIASVAPRLAPDSVTVSCDTAGVHVSATEVRTRPTGVALVVSTSLPAGAYLTYLSTGPNGGDQLPSEAATWTMPFPPGTITLGCFQPSTDRKSPTTTVRVIDPDHNWRGTEAFDELGCHGGGLIDWKGPFFQKGTTEAGAVHAVAGAFAQSARNGGTPSTYTVERLEVGYRDAPSQTWLVRLDGEPHATVVVTKEGDHYAAGADASCGPGLTELSAG